MFDTEEFDNNHRCVGCGVTGGGVEDGLCGDCLKEKEGE